MAIKNLTLLFIVLYSGYTIGFSVYKNYLIDQEIISLKANNIQLESEIQNLTNLTMFYQTITFAEIEARQKMNLKKVDEKVFVVNADELKKDSATLVNTSENSGNSTPITQDLEPNYEKWYRFVFNSDSA